MVSADSSGQSDTFTDTRRRNQIVGAVLQGKWVAVVVTAVLAVSALITVLTYGVLYQAARTTTLYDTATSFSNHAFSLALCALGLALAPALALCCWGMLARHRINKPLNAIHRDLIEIAEGRCPRPEPLCKSDAFAEFHATLWRALDRLNDRNFAQQQALIDVWREAKAALNENDEARQWALTSIVTQLAPLIETINASPAASHDPTATARDEQAQPASPAEAHEHAGTMR